ncbi:MAG: hypothetical protein WC428_03970 [Candidatus Paceibacterota bacterium]
MIIIIKEQRLENIFVRVDGFLSGNFLNSFIEIKADNNKNIESP